MGPTTRPRPREIRHLRDQHAVRISWADGHEAEYPLAYLRGWCPCAGCQGHGGERRFIQVKDAGLEHIEGVGSYAVTFVWSDGHATGIYSYAYLRDLCPCGECT